MSDPAIRTPISPAEWAAVQALLLAYRREFENDTCFTSFEAETGDIEALYRRPGMCKLIAIAAGVVVGCVALRPLGDGVAEMKRLYVTPDFRGSGLGRDLVMALLDRARAMGYLRMVLDTSHSMTAAQGLYKRLGFQPVEPYRGQDPDEIICLGLELEN